MGILSNVIFHKRFGYCLTCEVFFGTNSKEALTHVIGKNHRKNLRFLFKTCITDPFCNCNDAMYSRVIRGAQLDISQLLQSCNEKNYIDDRNEKLICFVCQETVSDSTNGERIKKDLVHHLDTKAEAHFQIIKDEASWIYNLPNSNGYISFNKASVRCSVCDINIDFVDDLKLHAAVGHLQTGQHKNNLQQTISRDTMTEVIRAGGSDGLGISAPARDGPSTSQGLQQVPRRPVNTNKMEYDSIKRLIADASFAPHVQFLEFKGNTFWCTLCDVPLTISTSGSFNLEEHILGSAHMKRAEKRHILMPNRPQKLSANKQLDSTSPQDQIDKLSLEPEFAPHVKYLKIEGDQCKCSICAVSLTVSIKLNSNLKEHIQGAYHRKRFENMQVAEDIARRDKQIEQLQVNKLRIEELVKRITMNDF